MTELLQHPIVSGAVVEDPDALMVIDKLAAAFHADAESHLDHLDMQVWLQAQLDAALMIASATIHVIHDHGFAKQDTREDSHQQACNLLYALRANDIPKGPPQ